MNSNNLSTVDLTIGRTLDDGEYLPEVVCVPVVGGQVAHKQTLNQDVNLAISFRLREISVT